MIIVDRIEEGIAVAFDGDRRLNIQPEKLPAGTKEGSVLVRTAEGFALDPETEQRLRKEMAERTARLIKK